MSEVELQKQTLTSFFLQPFFNQDAPAHGFGIHMISWASVF